MKTLVIASVLLASTSSVISWKNVNDKKPGVPVSTTAATIRLAEAKASLSKQHMKITKNVLATADGGI